MILFFTVALGFFRRFSEFRRTASPVAVGVEPDAYGYAAGKCHPTNNLGIQVPLPAKEKFTLIEGVDRLEDDTVLMALVTRPDVLSVLRSQGHRLWA